MTMLKKIKEFIENSPVYISTCDRKCNPHVIVVACVKVIDDRKMLITDNYMKTTAKNLLSNSRVEALIYNKQWKGCRITGSAKYHKTGKWMDYVKSMKENKGHPAKGAVILTASRISNLD